VCRVAVGYGRRFLDSRMSVTSASVQRPSVTRIGTSWRSPIVIGRRQFGERKSATISPFSTRKFASTFIGGTPGRMTVMSAT
jgi:hypothetical protein